MRQFRLVHLGVAAALVAASATAAGLVKSAGAAGSGTASVLVPIVPCRLIDTRAGSDNVGTRTTPLGPADTATFTVWGTNGNCTIPATATGIATNATAVNPTANSYLTIFPADASPRPTASNLNVVTGGAPTPNQVTVGLSTAGAISAYNLGGTVDLVIDIVGYYQSASTGGVTGTLVNDDRYYTKTHDDSTIAAVNVAIATKQNRPTGTHVLTFGGPGFVPEDNAIRFSEANFGLRPYMSFPSDVCAVRPVELPDGATVTGFAAYVTDDDPTPGVQVTLWLQALQVGQAVDRSIATVNSSTLVGFGTIAASSILPNSKVVDATTRTYSVEFCGRNNLTMLWSGTITYTLP